MRCLLSMAHNKHRLILRLQQGLLLQELLLQAFLPQQRTVQRRQPMLPPQKRDWN